MTTLQFRLLHISDPHFGTTTPEKILILQNQIEKLKPHCIAISGDITQRATAAQFIEARQFTDALKHFPIMAIPGNHDISLFNFISRFLMPYRHFEKIFGFARCGFFESGNVGLVALNSTDPLRHVQGELSAQSLQQLGQFGKLHGLRIVMLHHPMDCNRDVDLKNLLVNSDFSHQLFQKAKVDLVLSGHIHDPLARLSNVRFPKSQRPFVISVAGTCLSSRIRAGAPNSFHMIDIDSSSSHATASMAVTRFDLSDDSQFVPVNVSMFNRDTIDRGWRAV